ncbi:hypothetical protein D5086_012461 [Populus alba]|uniref:Uncharacterized protein n=1 Tax=Populus alba TaxID=43335 RepID=A0ACC4C273_POPAL
MNMNSVHASMLEHMRLPPILNQTADGDFQVTIAIKHQNVSAGNLPSRMNGIDLKVTEISINSNAITVVPQLSSIVGGCGCMPFCDTEGGDGLNMPAGN